MRLALALFWILLSYRLLTDEAVAQTPTPVPQFPWPDQVTGYGRSVEGAKKDAVEQALVKVREYLQNLDPPVVAWLPSEEYLRSQVFVGPGEMGQDVDIPEVGPIKAWTLHLQSPMPSDLQKWARLDRDRRLRQSQENRQTQGDARLKVAGRVFACLWLMLASAFLHHQIRMWFPDRPMPGLKWLLAAIVAASWVGVWWPYFV